MHRTDRRFVLAAVFAAGCAGEGTSERKAANVTASPGPTWTRETAWRIADTPIVTIRTEDPSKPPLDPVAIVQLSDGRYVIGDGAQRGRHALLVYDSTGQFLAEWGGAGTGPGEFGHLYEYMEKLDGDTIAALDITERAYELYTADGTFVKQIKHTTWGRTVDGLNTNRPSENTRRFGGFPFGMLGDGTMLRPFAKAAEPPKRGRFWLEHQVGALGRTGIEVAIAQVEMPHWIGRDEQSGYTPFGLQPISEVGRRRWYYGTGERFVVQVFDIDGKPLHELARNLAPEPLTAREKEEYFRAYIRRTAAGEGNTPAATKAYLDRLDYPETKALFSRIVEDDEENVWVEHFRWPDNSVRPDGRATTWSVFDAAGLFLGEVSVPAPFSISNITSDKLLGFYRDDMDARHPQILRLVKPPTMN